jgi:putative membrane protein
VENEAQYHQTVNGVVADGFIPNADNGEVKQAFQAALQIFRAHQEHAESLVQSVARR